MRWIRRCARRWNCFLPGSCGSHLIDYKVRVLDAQEATAAKVRVLITSTDGKRIFTTMGVSGDVVEASWMALSDSIEYALLKWKQAQQNGKTIARKRGKQDEDDHDAKNPSGAYRA